VTSATYCDADIPGSTARVFDLDDVERSTRPGLTVARMKKLPDGAQLCPVKGTWKPEPGLADRLMNERNGGWICGHIVHAGKPAIESSMTQHKAAA